MNDAPRRAVAPLALLLLLAAAPGCGSGPEGGAGEEAAPAGTASGAASGGEAAPPVVPKEVPGPFVGAPAKAPPPIPADTGMVTTPSGLRYSVLAKGAGTVHPKMGEKVRVHYTGWTTDGRVFDSSRERGEPAEFQVGGVIEGWNEALVKMVAGDRWKLTIPPDLGYGDSGAGAKIPPGATLVFDVELLKVFTIPPFVRLDPEKTTTTGSGLVCQMLEEGEGEPPAETDAYDLEYTFWNDSGILLESSGRTGQRLQGRKGEVKLKFLDEAPFLMKPGSTWVFEVPPALAFGESSPTPALPPGSTTIWRLRLVATASPLPVPEFRMPADGELRATGSGLRVLTLAEGEGVSPAMGQEVTVHYAGWLADGTLFDASYGRGFPSTFRLGAVIGGWNEGLQGMKPGGEAILVIPPALGYGPRGAGDRIPPDATLVFRVMLLKVGE